MQTKSRRLLSTLLALAMVFGLFAAMPLTASAANRNVAIEQSQTVSQIQSAIQAEINASSSGDTVTVTGSKTGVTEKLPLDIPSGRRVIWKAEYTGTLDFTSGPLIARSGTGTFEVAADAYIRNNGSGYATGCNDSGANIVVSGGTISASSYCLHSIASAITISGGSVEGITSSYGCSITVSGGSVTSAFHVYNSNSKVEISGGTVRAGGSSGVINCASGSSGVVVNITGGMVEATAASGKCINATQDNAKINISGGTVIATGTSGIAVNTAGDNSKINIDGGTVESTQYWAIYNEGKKSEIIVTDGTVKANGTGGRAIRNAGEEAKITVSGGTLDCGDEGISIANATGGGKSEIKVTNGTVRASGVNSTAIYNADTCPNCKITVLGGTVESVFRGIFNAGANSFVIVNGGVVTGTTGNAIQNDSTNSSVTVSGGFVFAYGTSTNGTGSETVIRMAGDILMINAPAVVCAWDKPSGTPAYTDGSSTNLTVNPTAATVKWAKSGSQSGINYKNGTNTGLFPVAGVTVNTVTTKPAAPTNLTATVDAANITLNWTDNSDNEDRFSIYRKEVSATGWSPMGRVPSNTTTFVDSTAETGKTYNYKVQAYASTGDYSDDSNIVTVTMSVNIAPTITGPTTMTLTAGYAATSTAAYTVSGTPVPTVSKISGDSRITWNSSTKKLVIAAGLTPGTYQVIIRASTGVIPDATLTFTLTVMANDGTPFPFTDVPTDSWYYSDVKTAWEQGLINGKSATLYAPFDNLTYAEAVKLAACMHQLHTTGSVTLVNGAPNWYDSYAKYAKDNSIINKDYNWSAQATRAGYMEIFANCVTLDPINTIADGSIPDVPMTHPQAAAIYRLYRAGILQGVDEAHNCNPGSNIRRNEVAAILTRMMNPDKRVTFSM